MNRKSIAHSIAANATPDPLSYKGRGQLEGADPLELGHARVDLGALEPVEALRAEALDVERGARGAVRHRAPQRRVVHVAVPRGEVAHQPAGEGVAGARRL